MFNINGEEKKVKFQLMLILGANLGSNQIRGFVAAFIANYFCRMCKVTYAEACQIETEP